MNPINLVPFADHSQKLPSKFLAPVEPIKTNSTWKILSAHFIDFTIAFSTSTFMSVIFGQSIKSLLITSGLKAAFSKQSLMPLEVSLLPLVLMSYFFMCYFMNHGQTIGMNLLKCRVSMKSQSFKQAFHWATHSTLLSLSLGVSYLLTKKNWETLKAHDYLYDQMMVVKEISPMNLLSKIEEIETTPHHEMEEDWSQAA